MRCGANQPVGNEVSAKPGRTEHHPTGTVAPGRPDKLGCGGYADSGACHYRLVVAFDRPELIRPPSVRAALQQAGVPDQATIVVAFIIPLAATHL